MKYSPDEQYIESIGAEEWLWKDLIIKSHILTLVSPPGGGKTSKFILPILYDDCLCKTRSTIVLDSKPEMWGKLANFTRKYNPEKELLLFNPQLEGKHRVGVADLEVGFTSRFPK